MMTCLSIFASKGETVVVEKMKEKVESTFVVG